MANKPKKQRVAGGVDTHGGTHHAAVVLINGRRLADAQFSATAARIHAAGGLDARLR
jgi:transposase